MSTTTPQVPEPVHLVALTGIHTLEGKVRYACEHTWPSSTPGVVRAWLARYHVSVDDRTLLTVVSEWGRDKQARSVPPAGPAPTAAAAPASLSRVRREPPPGAKGFYLAAFLTMLVSIDTSWLFFGEVLDITDIRERVVMFAVLEVAFIACGYGMRANVHRTGRPGAPRLIAWLLCGLAGYMAWQLSGVGAGLARVALGPVLGLVMLHLALGIEKRAGGHQTGTWVRVGRELRERLLSRVGLADDTRDALARTRDRAVQRAARLAVAGRLTPFRQARLARALRAGNVPHDASARARLLADLATARHAAELGELSLPSPWHTGTDAHPSHTAADDTPQATSQEASREAPHDASRPAGDTRRVAPATTPSAGPAARTRTRAPKTPREARNSAAGSGKRPTREEYLARARAALTNSETNSETGSEPVTVTARWVQAAVPGISRSMSYVIADALSADPSTIGTDASADGAVDSVQGHGPEVPPDGTDGPGDVSQDVSQDVSVDTDRLASVNGGAR